MMKYVVGLSLAGIPSLAIAGVYTFIQNKKNEIELFESLIKDGILKENIIDDFSEADFIDTFSETSNTEVSDSVSDFVSDIETFEVIL